MKYSDDDIMLVKCDGRHTFEDFLPSKDDYLYMKVLSNGKIISVKGKYLWKIFKLTKRKVKNKPLLDINREFFKDYLQVLLQKAKDENSAYQFGFQYKDDLEVILCSIYPCMVYEECKSFDIVIRNIGSRSKVESLNSYL